MLGRLFLTCAIIFGTQCAAQDRTDERVPPSCTFLPGFILFHPLTASYQEPHVGLQKETGSSRMKLDIGSTLDLVEYRIDRDNNLHVGIDFFTYALTTSSQGLRLQVDAVDGFFGGHVSFARLLKPSRVLLRLRLLHLSAHFLDGHFDQSAGKWKDGREPLPFTKDFGELTGAYEFNSGSISVLVYTGFSYATLIRPVSIKRLSTLHGFELHTSSLTGTLFGRPWNVYAADHFTLVGIPGYVGSNTIECGVKFGEWRSQGIKIYASYYNGLDPFSQYYDIRREQWGIGFTFDFW